MIPSSHPAARWPLTVPVLTDGVVTLRAHTPADVDAAWEMAQDPDMQRFTAIPVPHTREQSEEYALAVVPRGWDEGTRRGWAIEATDDAGRSRYAGNVDLRGTGVADVGYALHPWARGRGLMTRAVRLAVDHAFTSGLAEAVRWNAHVGNLASLRVAHACGFTLVAEQPAMLWERERAIDAWTAVVRFGDAPVPRTRWVDEVLETERLRIRPFREDDVPRLVEAWTDPSYQRWLGAFLPSPVGPASARTSVHRTWWDAARGDSARWAIADASDDRLLGNVSLLHLGGFDPDHAELGYWLHPDARGRGVAAEAARAVIDLAMSSDGLGLRRLALYAAAGNEASAAAARRLGFTQCGVESQAEILGDGTRDDLVAFELLR